jgi:hypothetical protein
MIVIDWRPATSSWTACIWTGTELGWIASGHADAVLRSAKVPRVTVSDDAFDGIIEASRTTTVAPSTLDARRKALWTGQAA